MPDFTSLLDKPVDSFEAPKPLPTGSYIWAIVKYAFDKSKEKKTDFVRFTVKPVQALEDVDQAELAEVEKWTDKELNIDFFITPDAMFRLRQFLENDVKCASAGQPAREAIQAAVGEQFVGMVGHMQSTRNADVVYANIVQTAPLPE